MSEYVYKKPMEKMPSSYFSWRGSIGDSNERKMDIMIMGYVNDKTNYYSWGRHNNVITLGNFRLFFHYNIPVAFKDEDSELVITRNENGCCGVGRALNSLDRNKNIRIGWNNFYNKLLDRLRQPSLQPREL